MSIPQGVNFHLQMPDGSMRYQKLPYVKGQSVKEYANVAISQLSESDRQAYTAFVEQCDLYYLKKVDESLFQPIVDWMEQTKMDEFSFVEVDKETMKPIARYTLKKEFL